MDATRFPDITRMTLQQAKDYLLERAKSPTDSHDLIVDSVARQLVEAAEQIRQASEIARGTTSWVSYGVGDEESAPATSVLYDAAWELVREGLLRPGPRFFGVLNARESGFSLTAVGKERLGLA